MRNPAASVSGHAVRLGITAYALVMACTASAQARQSDAPKLTFYPSLQVRFLAGQPRNFFFSQSGVVNASGAPMKSLTLTQKFPQGFTARLISQEAHAVFKRPEGFSEKLEGNAYTVSLPELRIAEAITLAVELTYQGRPALTTFPGVEVSYAQGDKTVTEKGPDQTWDLSRYTKYSGTLREYIKRYAATDLAIPDGEEWGFSTLSARAAGRVASGPVDIEGDPKGRMRFSIQAGVPGNLRQFLFIRRPFDPSRQPKANDEVRRLVGDLVQSTADFTLDADNMSIQKKRVGRWDAWVVDTVWRDRVKDRMGEGPSRWYIFADERNTAQYVINISAQGRGTGPGKSDVPNPAREQELMTELERIVTSLRLIQ